jgi:hypothetical protein
MSSPRCFAGALSRPWRLSLLWCAGRIFHCSFCSAQRLRPYDCNAPGRRKLVGVLLGRKAGGAHFSQAQPFSFGFGRKSLAFRTKPDHLAMVERRDRHERMFAEASDCRYRTKSIANIERLSSSMAGFGPILSKNYVVTHGS